jgi:energy-coupling factor transport system permease protein
MDRAVDVAATLELRGYGGAARPARRHRPWSRHDLAFAASALALALVSAVAFAANWEAFRAYPAFSAPVDGRLLVVTAVLALVALLPFADRLGIGP